MGPVGFVRLCFYNLWLLASGRFTRHSYVYDDSFDRQYGVDTLGVVEVDELSAPDHLKQGAVRYEPTSEHCFAFLLEQAGLEQRSADFTFIDLGSGKGRVLLLAALRGFRRAVGVELGADLHEIATRNIAVVAQTRNVGNIESINGDATAFPFPAEPTVCFLNNPFDQAVLCKVLDRIEASLASHPREFWIIYLHANHPAPFARHGQWDRMAVGHYDNSKHPYAVYRWRSAR